MSHVWKLCLIKIENGRLSQSRQQSEFAEWAMATIHYVLNTRP